MVFFPDACSNTYNKYAKFEDFTSSKEEVEVLTKAFFETYENSGNADTTERVRNALKWYSYFSDFD